MEERRVRTLERVFKGVANHWRIKTLFLILEEPGINLEEIVGKLKSNYQTTAEHVRRLKIAGLIIKSYKGKAVAHELSPYGKKAVKVLQTFLD